jgi:methylenetetrahydrofolate dehydrogenase (NADP+)/methenyltetrahydrofolate cyclohydrolase
MTSSGRLLEGRPAAEAIWQAVEKRATAFMARAGRAACLALVEGADEGASAYARQLERQFSRRGLSVRVQRAPADPAALKGLLRNLSSDRAVDGVLVLTPLPEGIDLRDAILALDPSKDVDGQHPESLGRLAQRRSALAPATALGGLRLLQHYDIPLRGQHAVIVGRSPVVGLPLTLLLLDADATVSVAHSRTPDLPRLTRDADVLCVAAGRPGLIGPEHVRPGSTVLDFGSPQGDVQTEAVAQVAGSITPVPGGTGPMTVAVLAEQTLAAADAHV